MGLTEDPVGTTKDLVGAIEDPVGATEDRVTIVRTRAQLLFETVHVWRSQYPLIPGADAGFWRGVVRYE